MEPYYYLWRSRRFDIHRCARCTHQFVYPAITREDQALIYSDAYFSEGGDWACGHFDGVGYLEAEKSLRREARDVLGMLPVRQGRLLDIGCAGGVFLDEARAYGFDVVGIEPNATMARTARERFRLCVENSLIEDIPVDRWNAEFDVITALDCLEHIPDARGAMERLSRFLRPGGYLLIRGPLANSTLGRLKETVRRVLRLKKQLPGYPLDVNVFNKRSLTELLRSCGLEPVSWIRETSDFANLLARKRG
ncbi:MAG TPA: class I SAM-dependent methyltransferase [Steroidobacteraceae bacterium]